MRTNNHQTGLTKRGINALVKRQDPREEYVTPVSDVFETRESFILKLDMPGAVKESITVTAEPMILTIKGPVGSLHQEQQRLLVNEIILKTYFRQFHLTSGLDHSRIQAEFGDGVLTVTIPKTDDFKLKEIPVQ